ncbi:MAG: hypothetical protein COA79_16285 [Planctomycetota bacterium]|nr:MAG: hypothetical protein COA79_16285 [Planctomycetota bacterium]
MKKYILYGLLSSMFIIMACGNIETETVVLNKSPDNIIIKDIVDEETAPAGTIEVTDKQFVLESGQEVNVDLSALITNFDATESYVYLIITPPTNGLVSIQNELLTYTPSSVGSDLMEFKVSTTNADSNLGLLSFTINETTIVPTTTTLTLFDTTLLNVEQDKSKDLNLSSIIKNFSSTETYNFAIVQPPSKGQVSLNGLNLTYIPFNNITGSDRITLRAGDGNSTSNIAEISISIQSESNSAPNFGSLEFEVKSNTPFEVDLLTQLLPPHPFDAKVYTFEITFDGQIGTGVISGNTLTYTPINNGLGKDSSMRILVTDDLGQTDESTIIFNISL